MAPAVGRHPGIYRRRGRKIMVNAAPEENLVKRNFTAAQPDALRLKDITEHPADKGRLSAPG
jgi:hypothetical protein